jgi:hypothetical protein
MKKQYRIAMFDCNKPAETIALLAAKSNGGNYVSIKQMAGFIDYEVLLYPTLYDGLVARVIDDNKLYVDLLQPDGRYKNILFIEEVDVFELPERRI